jgi:hypothetical protein
MSRHGSWRNLTRRAPWSRVARRHEISPQLLSAWRKAARHGVLKEALRIRRDETKDLDEAIVGDLRTADFGQRTFDVIFNSYVLEHVPGAQQVLENFNRWVKRPG